MENNSQDSLDKYEWLLSKDIKEISSSQPTKMKQDCAVCLQKYYHPTQLPCGHVFCFLCVKGIAIQSKKCAMCRTQIPADYFDHPVFVQKSPVREEERISLESDADVYQWYYEGRNGWWKYDERSNTDLETAYTSEQSECLLLLAGTIYCVNFQNMIQIRRSDPTRRRRVKRDVPTLPSKGTAGIKNINPTVEEILDTESDIVANNVIIIDNESNDNILVEIDDPNTDGNITQPVQYIEDITESLRHFNLNSEESTLNSNPEEME